MPLRSDKRIPIVATPAPVAAAPLAAAVGDIVLDVPYIRQKQNQWCWAACAQMIAAFLGKTDVTQCKLANFLHGQTKCCQHPGSNACNQPSPYPGIAAVYRFLEIACISDPHAETLAVMLRELSQGRPVEVGYLWYGGGGHVAIVYGVNRQGVFSVHDPWFGSGPVTYLGLLTAYGQGRWGMSFGGFRNL